MSSQNEFLSAALRYRSIGLSVIPIQSRSKTPAINSWREYQNRLPTEDEPKKEEPKKVEPVKEEPAEQNDEPKEQPPGTYIYDESSGSDSSDYEEQKEVKPKRKQLAHDIDMLRQQLEDLKQFKQTYVSAKEQKAKQKAEQKAIKEAAEKLAAEKLAAEKLAKEQEEKEKTRNPPKKNIPSFMKF
jgi:septal ring factor EnvC (AmiA/AmiB activator)